MDIITDNFDKMSINQIYAQLSQKYEKLQKIDQKENLEKIGRASCRERV